jgi:Pvc16 N-terminal domain
VTTYQGIAAVTQTLSFVVGNAVRAVVPEATLSIVPPEQPAAGARDAPRVNVYLIQVAPDPTRRNTDLPMRDPAGGLVTVPTVVLDLRYMLSFFGATERAHLMLGAVEVALHEQPVLDPATVVAAVAGHPDLLHSGLDRQLPPVRIVPSPATLEELSRFWSGFFQTPYTLSTFVVASSVQLQSALTPAATLPVAPGGSRPASAPGHAPRLAPLAAAAAAPGTVIPVAGHGVVAGLHAEVAGRWSPIAAAKDGGLAFVLPAGTPAGRVEVRLGTATGARGVPAPIPGAPIRTLELWPIVERVVLRDGAPTATFAAPVGPGQRVTLSLVGLDAQGELSGASAEVAAADRTETTEDVIFAVPSQPLAPGRYLARAHVDGVASLLAQEHGKYAEPHLVVA